MGDNQATHEESNNTVKESRLEIFVKSVKVALGHDPCEKDVMTVDEDASSGLKSCGKSHYVVESAEHKVVRNEVGVNLLNHSVVGREKFALELKKSVCGVSLEWRSECGLPLEFSLFKLLILLLTLPPSCEHSVL